MGDDLDDHLLILGGRQVEHTGRPGDGRTVGLPHVWARPTLRLVVGAPVVLDDLRDAPVDAAVLHEATARIMAALTALVEQLRGDSAPAERFDPRTSRSP